jgi:hypothetical protein
MLLISIILFSCENHKDNVEKQVQGNCIYTIQNNIRNGEYICYFDTTFKKIKEKGIYVNNKLNDTIITFYRNGKVKSVTRYKNGKRIGLYKRYSAKGKLIMKVEFLDPELFNINDEFVNRVWQYNLKGEIENDYSNFYEIVPDKDTLILYANLGNKLMNENDKCRFLSYYVGLFDEKNKRYKLENDELISPIGKDSTILKFKIPLKDKKSGNYIKGKVLGVFDCKDTNDDKIYTTNLYFNYDIINKKLLNY